ncbi:MAG: D-alanyl-D-alanine carboxypeptidase family protein [Aestuariivirga sp.]
MPATSFAGPSLVFDVKTGRVIAHDRAGEPWYPASLTKLMTAYVVFQKIRAGKLKLDQKIPVSFFATTQPPSKIGLKVGNEVTVDFALQALLVYSANDMAYVLAEGASGTMVNFVSEMNAQAKRLGLTSTNYANPNGLFDPRQISTARDIGILAATLLAEFPEHNRYFAQGFVQAGNRKLPNRNSLLRLMKDADGMKTGFVCNSGFNLVASATRNGQRLVAIVLGDRSGKARTGTAQKLLLDGFAQMPSPQSVLLAQLPNDPLGAVVPADMTETVCKGKPLVAAVSAKELAGWGVSFGTYDTAVIADKALRGRLIGAAGLAAPGDTGVVRMPGPSNYAAMIWNIDQSASLSLCARYRAENAVCDVMTPQSFQRIAALAPEPPAPVVKASAQGSDAGKSKKKKRRVRKKY